VASFPVDDWAGERRRPLPGLRRPVRRRLAPPFARSRRPLRRRLAPSRYARPFSSKPSTQTLKQASCIRIWHNYKYTHILCLPTSIFYFFWNFLLSGVQLMRGSLKFALYSLMYTCGTIKLFRGLLLQIISIVCYWAADLILSVVFCAQVHLEEWGFTLALRKLRRYPKTGKMINLNSDFHQCKGGVQLWKML